MTHSHTAVGTSNYDGGGENDIDDGDDVIDDDDQEAAHVSRYPQVEAEVPLLRRALQLHTIFGAAGLEKHLRRFQMKIFSFFAAKLFSFANFLYWKVPLAPHPVSWSVYL